MELSTDLARKLATHVILAQRREGDTLVLDDEIMLAALDGRCKLTPEQSSALTSSPLTLRRFSQLAMERRQQGQGRAAANDAVWRGSAGLLRAASSGDMAPLTTDDGFWTLHVAGVEGDWRLIVTLAADAPFAASLLRSSAGIKVLDGRGEILLEGELDADGECEAAWPRDCSPYQHLQDAGARFSVKPN